MLSDRELQTLREFERRFVAEDPEFVRSFHTHRHGRLLARFSVATGLLISAFLLVAGAPGGALIFAVATGLVWVVWRCPATGRGADGTGGGSAR